MEIKNLLLKKTYEEPTFSSSECSSLDVILASDNLVAESEVWVLGGEG